MNIAMVATELTKWIAYGQCKVVQVFGFNNQTADRYIQFHAKPAIAASDVPAVKSLTCFSAAPFSWAFDDLQLAELFLAISTTEVNYTAPGAGEGLDLTAVVMTDFPVVSGVTTLVGDLTTAVASRQIWASASGPKRLLRLDVVNNSGGDAFSVVQASDAAATTDRTAIVRKVADTETLRQYFGRAGHRPYRKDDSGTEHKGCTVRIATPSGANVALPFNFDSVTDYAIRAIYE